MTVKTSEIDAHDKENAMASKHVLRHIEERCVGGKHACVTTERSYVSEKQNQPHKMKRKQTSDDRWLSIDIAKHLLNPINRSLA